ncbi:hypothetical protein J2T12_000886 [Paenibacillus anaericanus]|uniref:copper amine oxidase N-terminal domain-containing protein n=1 Tax=Paenibacillus anaericanus TaxID=170367 RepID=UPI002783E865|nr:copper amine oxidase N-terminal domain-containing protein [Paenibacillus anaericanus]MDQ0087492.1 hypothetical protein [Paenibacillus anaericanus]
MFQVKSKNNAGLRSVKKISVSVFMAMIVSSMLATGVFAAGSAVSVVTDGEKFPFSSVVPYVENGTTMVPLRFVSEKLGAEMSWNNQTKAIGIQSGERNITLTVGSASATVNGEEVSIGTKVVQSNGVTMVPLRFVSELLSAEVKWDGETGTAFINTPGKELGELDPFGRKIRTTNLPKNYKDYPYILEDIPNEMYEMQYPDSLEDKKKVSADIFQDQEFTTEDLKLIMGRAKAGFELRLNVDYRTIDPEPWAKDLYQYMNKAMGEVRVVENKEYANWVKKNKIILEGSIDPEPTMMYNSGLGGRYVRAKVRFRINNYAEYKNLIYDPFLSNAGKPKKGVWYVGYTDIWLSSNVSGDLGNNLNISSLASIFRNYIIHEEK